MALLGVGIISFNDIYWTQQCVRGVLTCGNCSVEDVVVLDNGSTKREHLPELQAWLVKEGVQYIENDVNTGIYGAFQTLCESISTEVICLLNNDVIFSYPQTFACLKYFFENNQVGAAGWPIRHVEPKTFTHSPDPCKFVIDTYGNIMLDESGLPQLQSADKKPEQVLFPHGCCFGILREAWKHTRGWPKHFGSYHEEQWMGLELTRLGYKNYVLPFPSVGHIGGVTFRDNPELQIREFDDRLVDRDEYESVLTENIAVSSYLRNIRDFYGGFVWEQDGRKVTAQITWSRYLVCKVYNALQQFGKMERILELESPNCPVKWMNKEGRECQWD